jgi:hypothetical protein
MAAPTMSYLICSIALVALIVIMPFFFAMERDSLAEQIAKRELTEISDYTSNTIANLFFLAKSTNSETLNLSKELIYLPLTVEGSFYKLNIVQDGDSPLKVVAFLRDKPWVAGESWVAPGPDLLKNSLVDIDGSSVTAKCDRNVNDFYVWLEEN